MQKPDLEEVGLLRFRVPDDDLLSHGESTLSSACRRFTVLFGMGRRGANGLWSSGVEQATGDGAQEACCRWLPREEEVEAGLVQCEHRGCGCSAYGYGVKPHGLLVPVSLRHYCPSTPGLSTWWSATTLQGAQGPGRSHLQARFPLRCFQRLSLPYIATRQCDWRHNRYTSGTSTPVLSY